MYIFIFIYLFVYLCAYNTCPPLIYSHDTTQRINIFYDPNPYPNLNQPRYRPTHKDILLYEAAEKSSRHPLVSLISSIVTSRT